MSKMNLAEQIRSVQYGQADDKSDFDSMLKVSGRPSDKIKVVMLPIGSLVDYKDENFEKITGRPQPFHSYSEEDLKSLARSIAENGVIDPITVRPISDGKYQIIAGRNRTRASKLCGLLEIPGIIRTDIDDIKAAMLMIDTNLEQRHNLSYSEKAYAYKMRLDLQKRQGKRTDLEENSEKYDSLNEAGKQHNHSRRTVAYLIRLTYLIPDLITLIDSRKIGFKVGVEMSYLSTATQKIVFTNINLYGVKPTKEQIKTLRKAEENGEVSAADVKSIFYAPKSTIPSSFTIRGSVLKEYADILSDSDDVERLFLEFLKSYRLRKST